MSRPSLPVLNRDVLDHSILSTHASCPRLAFYKYGVNRRVKKDDTVSIDFGTAYHLFREQLEKEETRDIVATTKAAQVALKHYKDPETTHKKGYLDRKRLTESCMVASDKINRELRSNIKVLHTETSFDLPLPSGRRYGGRFDQIILWNNKLYVRDFKTKSWMLTDAAKEYELDHQMSGYVWAAQHLCKQKIEGVIVEVMYNTLKQGPEIKPLLSTRTPEQIDNFIEWAEAEWDSWEKACKTGTWQMRTNTCFRFNKKCIYHDACSSGNWESVEAWLEDNTVESVWDFSANVLEGDDV